MFMGSYSNMVSFVNCPIVYRVLDVQTTFPFRLHRRKTDNQGRTLLPLFRLYTMDNVLNAYWGSSISFLIIFLTYAASCCVTFGRKMSASSWMGIEDGTFHQTLCNSDILTMVKFKSLYSSSVDLSNYKRLFQEVSHQTSMLGLAWIMLLGIMAYNLYLLLQAFVLTMVTSSLKILVTYIPKYNCAVNKIVLYSNYHTTHCSSLFFTIDPRSCYIVFPFFVCLSNRSMWPNYSSCLCNSLYSLCNSE